MKRTTVFGIVLLTIALHVPSFAQLKTRSELLHQKYIEDRSKGLIALNERFIEAFNEQLRIAIDGNQLDEVTFIQERIAELNADIVALKKAAASAAGDKEEKHPLEGNTLTFKHPNNPEDLALIEFHENGEAFWLGTGNQRVERMYKPGDKPGEFIVWWPNRPDKMEYRVRVAEEGKIAEVMSFYTKEEVLGTLEKTR